MLLGVLEKDSLSVRKAIMVGFKSDYSFLLAINGEMLHYCISVQMLSNAKTFLCYSDCSLAPLP